MDLNYAIFKSEPIMTLNDLAQIGSHNKREKKAYKSNPDIKLELTKDNIELVPLADKYVKGFYNLTKEYKKEHDERMKTEREDRKRTFNQMLNKSKSVVADELLFTATHEFFKDMNKEDIKKWAEVCMDFVYEDLGYTKEQVLHAVVHLDEKTPHVHCVVVPLVKKYDKRTNTERYTISKKQYIRDKIHLSELQDIYHKRLTDNGYDLERGIKHSDNESIPIREYKKITRKLNHSLNVRNERLENVMTNLEEQMKSNKEVMFDKEYVKVKKETFDTMNHVFKETKKVMEIQPKLQQVFDEVDSYSQNYHSVQKENKRMKKEVETLKSKNKKLQEENKNLISYIKSILKVIKHFFRELLQIGNEKTKEATTNEIKDYFDNEDFNKEDIYDIAIETTKEDELFDYADIPSYMKINSNNVKEVEDKGYEMEI